MNRTFIVHTDLQNHALTNKKIISFNLFVIYQNYLVALRPKRCLSYLNGTLFVLFVL